MVLGLDRQIQTKSISWCSVWITRPGSHGARSGSPDPDQVDLMVLGLDRQIQTRRGIWQPVLSLSKESSWSIF
jgi:hypothetical protein